MPITQHGLILQGMDQEVDRRFESLSYELYDVLGLSVTGEAFTIVRSVHGMNGMEAWMRLNRRSWPKTPARTLVKLMDVLSRAGDQVGDVGT